MSNDLFNKPILIFSSYCKFSQNFLEILMKHPQIYDNIIRMNIDVDATTKQRPQMFYKIQQILNRKISKVPTIITKDAEHVLSDADAFKWLEYNISSLNKEKTGLSAFNPDEMISFSDHYAKFGSTELNDANEQSYKFYVNVNNNGKREKILPSDNYLNTDKTWDPNASQTHGFLDEHEQPTSDINYNNVYNERQYFDDQQQKQRSSVGNIPFKKEINQDKVNQKEYSSFSQNRQNVQQQQQQQRQSINFTDPAFGLSGQLGGKNSVSKKEKELDSKLSQLLQDREQIDSTLQTRRRI